MKSKGESWFARYKTVVVLLGIAGISVISGVLIAVLPTVASMKPETDWGTTGIKLQPNSSYSLVEGIAGPDFLYYRLDTNTNEQHLRGYLVISINKSPNVTMFIGVESLPTKTKYNHKLSADHSLESDWSYDICLNISLYFGLISDDYGYHNFSFDYEIGSEPDCIAQELNGAFLLVFAIVVGVLVATCGLICFCAAGFCYVEKKRRSSYMPLLQSPVSSSPSIQTISNPAVSAESKEMHEG